MQDDQGVLRGGCGCGCDQYTPSVNFRCVHCNHRPGSHFVVHAYQATITTTSSSSGIGKTCALHGCNKLCYIDNTGTVFDYCSRSHGQLDAQAKHNDTTCKLPGCKAARYNEAGKIHEFCSRTHAVQYTNLNQAHVAPRDRCQFPNCTNPKYRDERGVHDYCGKTHAYAMCFAGGGGNNTCEYNGCQNKKWFDGAKVYDFCSKTHAEASREQMLKAGICVTCRNTAAIQPAKDYQHCPRCWMANMSALNTYHERDLHIGFLPKASTKFTDLSEQFVNKWQHAGNPQVVDILIFLVPQSVRTAYYTYRDDLEARGQFLSKGLHAGNEKRRFHGTKQRCNFGRAGNAKPCKDDNCNVCRIIRTSFQLSYAGASFGNVGFGRFGRFGRGIYSTATSSKSNDYNKGSEKTVHGVTTRAMFAVKVALGRGFKILQDDPAHETMETAPKGFDSVLGEVGQSLNYDECVVYNEAAALPAYLIIYQC